MNERVFKSIEEFERHYFPKDCERHPVVVMRVSKEEADYIRHRRGGWGAKKR